MTRMRHERTVLPSGLRVVSERATGVNSVSVGVWLDVGSRNEVPELAGLSHLIEHMTFKGTPRRSAQQIVWEFESRGGAVNAFTSREQTCYYAKVLDAHLPVAIDVLGDIVQHSRYSASELSREQKIVLEEIKDVRDTPSDWVHDKFAEAHWGKQSLGLPVLGLKSTVSRVQREDILAYRRRYYRPEHTVIAACGAVEHHRLVDLVDKHFGRWKPGARPRQGAAPTPARRRTRVIPRASAQTHMVVGFPSLSYVDPRKYAILVLHELFGGGMSSRLFQRVREELGLAYSIFSYQDSYRDCGVFGFYLATESRRAALALQVALRELARLRAGELTEEDVRAAREQLKGHLVLGLENTSSRMNRLARHEIYTGAYLSLPATLREIDRICRDDVVALAAELAAPQRLTAVVMGPLARDFYRGFDWSVIA